MSVTKLKPIKFHKNIMMGCDPEFFFSDEKGQVVGSEKVLPKGGITSMNGMNNKTVIDGVQAELNPAASYCRQILAGNIQNCFTDLRARLHSQGVKVKVQVDSLVDVSRQELDSLSEGCQVFGCAPSTNIYNEGENKTSKIKVDAKKYLKRSAGGHIHLGNAYESYLNRVSDPNNAQIDEYIEKAKSIEKALKKMPDVMVAVLDIVVGNTCVLLDQSEGNKERRANYGRAGEYRLKPYGIEYRTLSNFWLRSYQLMSFVTGLCRFAIHLVSESTPKNDYVKALFDAVPREDIIKAINENDVKLAMENFKKIEQILIDSADENTGSDFYPIRKFTIKYFHHFVFRIQQKGIKYWFPDDPMTHWCGRYELSGGWETFCDRIIHDDLNRHEIDLSATKRLDQVKMKKFKFDFDYFSKY